MSYKVMIHSYEKLENDKEINQITCHCVYDVTSLTHFCEYLLVNSKEFTKSEPNCVFVLHSLIHPCEHFLMNEKEMYMSLVTVFTTYIVMKVYVSCTCKCK